MSNVTVHRVRLENKQGTSYKFYAAYFVPATGDIVFHWGRIGTAGQSKWQCVPGNAETVAMKQVWSKAGRGYTIIEEGFTFELSESDLQQAMSSQTIDVLEKTARQNKSAAVTVSQDRMVEQYDVLIERMNGFLVRLRNESFLDVYDEFQAIETTWKQVVDAHELAATTIDLTKQMLMEKL